MKKLLVVSAIAVLGLTSVAFAGGIPEEMPAAPAAIASSDTGIYLGLSGGFGMTNWKNVESANLPNRSVSKDNGVVGRVFAGYDLNRYFAVEAGYSYFFNKSSLQDSGVERNNFKTQAIDLFGKIKAPVVENFDLYAKLGAAYLMSNVSASTNAVLKDGNIRNFSVAFGAGADYYITPNVIANIEWLRIAGHPKDDAGINEFNYQPNTDAFMVGLRYKFDL